MSLGLGLFLGLTCLSLVLLFVATKDRWRWKRIVLWSVCVPTAVCLLGAGWYWISGVLDDRPKPASEFWELRPGLSSNEVLFRKGMPADTTDGLWWYKPSNDYEAGYLVRMRDRKVRYVMAYAASEGSLPVLQGISSHSTQQDITAKFGPPDCVSESGDASARLLSFAQYRLVFELEKNRVTHLGVYDPTTGPVRYFSDSTTASSESN